MSTLATFLVIAFSVGVVAAFIAYILLVHRHQGIEARTVADLIESRRYYLALLDNSHDTIGVLDAKGRAKFFNVAFEKEVGISRSEIAGVDLRTFIHPDDLERFTETWMQLLSTTEPVEFEPFRYKVASGEWLYKHMIARNMLDDPDITGVVISTRNITDYVNALNELRLNEQRIRIALAGADICVYNLDIEGRCTWVFNPLFDYTPEELLGSNEFDVLPPGPAAQLAALRHKVLAEGGQAKDEVDFVDRGSRRVIAVSLERHLDQYGNIIGLVGAAANMTERKTSLERLQGAQRMEAIGKLTGGIAHDFNNLLAIIVGNLELLKDHLEDKPRLSHFVDISLRAADRGATLTRSLLAFARRQTLAITDVDPNKLLEEIHELLRRSLPPAIHLVLQPDPQTWHCMADAGQLQNAVINLVINSRDAMPSGGTITISTTNTRLVHDETGALPGDVATGDYVLIAVADTGTGMPPHVLEHVFEPFYTTKPPGSGTGLGLSIVYGIAKQIGGHVAIQSTEGQGTTVRLYLPRFVHEEKTQEEAAQKQTPAAKGEIILVVDDDDDVRQLTTALLQLSGYTVLEAENGFQALEILKTDTPISLMLTDVLLGTGPNGTDLMDVARTVRPYLPVVLMSGYTDMSMIEEKAPGPPAPLLHKPFRRHELEAVIHQTLQAASNPPSSDSSSDGK